MASISSGHAALLVAGIVAVFTLGRFSAGAGTEDRHVETGYRRNVPVRQQALASPDDVLQLPTASALKGDGAHAVLGDVPLLPRTQRAFRQSAVLPRINTAQVDYGPEYETEEQALR